jgi:transcriptional repressor NrdR
MYVLVDVYTLYVVQKEVLLMYCPYCSNNETKVLESRILDASMRRRRECLKCSNRFTTYEKPIFTLKVLKKDGREEEFSLNKIISSLQKACNKTDPEKITEISNKVQQKILNKKVNPVKSSFIGTAVLNELKKFDKIAYLRFTSVHKEIDDPKIFKKEINLIT